MLANHLLTAGQILAVDARPTKMGIIAAVVLPCVLGVAIWLFARSRPSESWMARLRWAAFLPLGFGVFNGGALAFRSMDSAYREYHLIGRDMVAMHWAAFIAPLICTVILAAWALMGKARQRRDF